MANAFFLSKLPPEEIKRIADKLLEKTASKERLNEVLSHVLIDISMLGDVALVKWLVDHGARNPEAIKEAQEMLEMAEEDKQNEKIARYKEILGLLHSK